MEYVVTSFCPRCNAPILLAAGATADRNGRVIVAEGTPRVYHSCKCYSTTRSLDEVEALKEAARIVGDADAATP